MADLSDPVVQAITTARVKLLLGQPFFGNLATRLSIVDASKWCESIATDGKYLYYNREFIKSLTEKELMFVLSHEVLHLVYDHLGRQSGKDKGIWDMANDYIVNYTLNKERLGTMPQGGLYSEKYTDEMTSEEVYEELEKNSVKIEMPLDMHLSLDGSDGEDGEGSSSGSVSVTIMGDENGPPQLTEEDKQKIKNEILASVINAAQAAGAGKVPAGVARLIEMFTTPVMDWRTLLETFIQSSVKDDYTFQKPNRRSWTTGCIMPGQNFMDTISIACAIDSSGSMSEEMLRDLLSEVKGIMETYTDFELWLWTFDTKVYNPKLFTAANLDEIHEYVLHGGGGTSFECNFDFMKNPSEFFPDIEVDVIEPSKLCIFSDGYPNNTWGDEDYCDTLFILHGTKSIVPPYGMVVYYEPK